MAAATETPMMRQYLGLKAQVPDAILLYRMGDFYELFFDDAREAAELLELTLTSRNKKDADPIPMAGVPHHALDGYLRRLVDAGRRVAIAEQKGSAPPAGSKLMAREIVRVVTPGIPWDADGLQPRESCYLGGLVQGKNGVGMAFLDATTGDLRITRVDSLRAAGAELERMEPRELVLPAELSAADALHVGAVPVTVVDGAWFDEDAAVTAICEQLGVQDLLGFGAADIPEAVAAAGALLTYARQTARIGLQHVRSLRPYAVGGHMVLDEATRRNLEILRPMRGTGRKGTLLHLMDRTGTPMGGRLLREWLARPLLELSAIQERHDAVEALLDSRLREGLREGLREVADLERLSAKVAQSTANARDLVALGRSLATCPSLLQPLVDAPALNPRVPRDLLPEVAEDVVRWLRDEPPASMTEGGLIRPGVHAELDELTMLAREGKGAIARMEARERERTGISSLKIKHNRVFGYFLEVTQSNLDKVPQEWIRKQTLASCERYITAELKEFEEKVLGADERRKQLEYALVVQLRERVAQHVERLQNLARALAWLDVVHAFAAVAADRRYTRPRVVPGRVFHLDAARHPVVESMDLEQPFVPNDLHLDEDGHLVILTGPNMSGKSTVMRQVALAALMAQCGAFVAAEQAEIGVCDRIFVRVGASDELARGRSTFMVEMSETAHILNHATAQSLVLLDEIGRGTSTYDGLAIAWAVAEAMHDRVGARTLFATHYHELVALDEDRDGVRNLHVAVSEWQDRIVFLHTLRQGGASKSYGIQCARLAGMPTTVVERARALLSELEKRPRYGPPTRQLSLFAPAAPAPDPQDTSLRQLRDALRDADPDGLSPREAHALLYELAARARGIPD